MQINIDSSIQPSQPTGGNEQLPDGKHVVFITDEKTDKNSAGTGEVLKLTFADAEGRVAYENLNVTNPNPTAVKIAFSTLLNIALCAGKPKITNTADLVGAKLMIETKARTYQRRDGGEGSKAEIVAYFDANGNDLTKAGRGASAYPTAAPTLPTGYGASPVPAMPAAPARTLSPDGKYELDPATNTWKEIQAAPGPVAVPQPPVPPPPPAAPPAPPAAPPAAAAPPPPPPPQPNFGGPTAGLAAPQWAQGK